ncbi:Interleukin-12 receptor subunit beta-2 [Oryzias melastigma]|uniref:Interleukin-12 receptor subunit beta-2 n=1 Tax=Oryzias melastigma TaxID=30732 RepID=A0A834FI32_ORYME|nr:Interleukin-12 receptor subunit beta-2 [Oryzias melastigma]
MAVSRTKCLFPILLTLLLKCAAAAVIPAAPSVPECYRPCNKGICSYIKCIWNPQGERAGPSPYRLRWEPENSEDGGITGGSSSEGIINRDQFTRASKLRVWVEVINSSVQSEEAVYHVEHIRKLPPPMITNFSQDPLEIIWIVDHLEDQNPEHCDVRYRTEGEKGWPSSLYENQTADSRYAVIDPQLFTVYQFQVRCMCSQCLMTPIGEVDMWRDCVKSHASTECFLTWKNLSNSQARGFILGYLVTRVYADGTKKQINVSTEASSPLWAHDGRIWRLTSSLKDVVSVSISAYNALGATNPSLLVLPAPGVKENPQKIQVEVTQENLTVSWDPSSHFSKDLMQYVVEYRVCPPGRGFDWIKVDKSLNSAVFKGEFKKYTAYHVSLFTVRNDKVLLLSTAIGYSVHGAPSKVPSFKVSSIAGTEATLFWEPVPCSKQNGVILYYQIKTDTQKVYNVSVTPDHGNKTFTLLDLNPDQEYTVWIAAVNAAGLGESVTTRFKTKNSDISAFWALIGVGTVVFLVLTCVTLFCCFKRNTVCPFLPRCLFEKEPDPSNSKIFKQIQMNEPLAWICKTIYDPNPKISNLEIVEKYSEALDRDGLTRPMVENKTSQLDLNQSDDVTPEVDRAREAYSKMVDSDEDNGDSSSSYEEEKFSSGYETHFMPTASEVLEIEDCIHETM